MSGVARRDSDQIYTVLARAHRQASASYHAIPLTVKPLPKDSPTTTNLLRRLDHNR